MSELSLNIERIRQEIAAAAIRSGRSPEEITLIAVTKTVEAERVNEIYPCGITEIGENRVQELMSKIDTYLPNFGIHFIGQLQTNKVKYILDQVKLIHSLDRHSLAKEIDVRAAKTGRTVPVLVEVNIGGEESKSGLPVLQVESFVRELEQYPHLQVQGLMTVAPYAGDTEEVRPYFRRMKALFEQLKSLQLPHTDMRYLSMGMSHDFPVAIEEGSNMVRVGTAIFGRRNYT